MKKYPWTCYNTGDNYLILGYFTIDEMDLLCSLLYGQPRNYYRKTIIEILNHHGHISTGNEHLAQLQQLIEQHILKTNINKCVENIIEI